MDMGWWREGVTVRGGVSKPVCWSEGGRGTEDSTALLGSLPGCRLAQQAPGPSGLGGTTNAPFPGHFSLPIVGHGAQTRQ